MSGIYDQYQKYGVKNYYKQFSEQYKNPHEQKITELYIKYIKNLISSEDIILDIACGDGLISKLVNKYNNNYNVKGTDPYFKNSYCHYNCSFEDIALGNIKDKYNIAICCYAYHLLENSWQFSFLNSLAEITDTFIIITPSKKINIVHPRWSLVKEFREDKITILVVEAKLLSP